MKGYVTHVEEATLKNPLYRQVLFTAQNSQLVLMSLKPGEEIGEMVSGSVSYRLSRIPLLEPCLHVPLRDDLVQPSHSPYALQWLRRRIRCSGCYFSGTVSHDGA